MKLICSNDKRMRVYFLKTKVRLVIVMLITLLILIDYKLSFCRIPFNPIQARLFYRLKVQGGGS